MADPISTKPEEFTTIIGPDAQFKGELTFQGVELRATAQLRGDVRAAKLLVVEGASFVGRCEVGPNIGAAAPRVPDGVARPASPPVAVARH